MAETRARPHFLPGSERLHTRRTNLVDRRGIRGEDIREVGKAPERQDCHPISHRFSTVRQADTIAVIEDGFLRELGMHNALLKKKGIYARLFKLQAKGYK